MISWTSKSLHKNLQDVTMISPCSCHSSFFSSICSPFFPIQLSEDFGSNDISLLSGSCLSFSLTLTYRMYRNFSFKQTNSVSVISWEISWWQLFMFHTYTKSHKYLFSDQCFAVQYWIIKNYPRYEAYRYQCLCKLTISDQANKIWKVRWFLRYSVEVVLPDT